MAAYGAVAGMSFTPMPNFLPEQTKTNAGDDRALIAEFFGPPRKPLPPNVEDGRPIEAETLADAYKGDSTAAATVVRTPFEDGSGWWTVLCPPERSSMVRQWDVLTAPATAMEPAPEDTAPRFVSHQVESHMIKLTRFSLGAEAHGDFFKTPRGQAAMRLNLAQIISGAWITAKLSVEEAVVSGTSYWQNWIAQFGQQHVNLKEAMQAENRLAFAFSFDPNALWKLNDQIQSHFSAAGVGRPNMMVVVERVLSFLAYYFKYNTVASLRGDARAERTLVLGARAIVEAAATMGLDIFENRVLRVNNVPGSGFNSFERDTSFSRFFHIDGSSNKLYNPDGTVDVRGSLSFQHASMDVDAYKTMEPEFMIDHCGRFTADGEDLNEFMEAFPSQLVAASQATEIPIDGENVDAYFWKTDATHDGINQHPVNDGWQVARRWGHMSRFFRSTKVDLEHGKAAKQAVRARLGDGVINAVDAVRSLSRALSSPGDLTDSVVAYALATAAAGSNTEASAMGVARGTTGSARDMPSRSTDDADRGALLVGLTDAGEKVYAIGFRLDTTTGGMRATPPIKAGMPAAIVFRTLPADATLNPTTLAITVGGALSASFGAVGLSTAEKLAAVPVPTTTTGGDPSLDPANFGVASAYVIRAPELPYGAGRIAHLERWKDEEEYNPDRPFKATVVAGVEALHKLHEWATKVYPYCPLVTDPAYCPAYLRTGDPATDAFYGFVENVVFGVSMPLWVVRPYSAAGIFGDADFSGVRLIGMGTTGEPLDTADVGNASLDAIAGAMGLVLPADPSAIRSFIKTLLRSDSLDPDVRDAMLGDDHGAELFAHFGNSYLGQSYEATRRMETGAAAGRYSNWATFWRTEVESRATQQRNAALEVASLALNHVLQSQQGGVSVALTREKINAWAKFAEGKRKNREASAPDVYGEFQEARNARGAVPGGFAVQDSTFHWVNTRLSIDPQVFRRLAEVARGSGSLTDKFSATSIPLRPGHPENPNQPLAPEIPALNPRSYGGRELDEALRTQVGLFEFARAGKVHQRSTLGAAWTRYLFNFPALGVPEASAKRYRADCSVDDSMEVSSGGTGFDEGRSNMPQGARLRPNSDLWVEQGYEDALGQEISEEVSFEQCKHLVARINEIANSNTDEWSSWFAVLMNFSKVNANSQKKWLEHNLPIPDSCYTFYQHAIRVKASASLWALKGSGVLGYNWEDAVIQFDATTKKWLVHYTTWLSCFVPDPSRMHLQRDTKFEGYRGGMDDSVYCHPSEFDPNNVSRFAKSGFIFSHGAEFTRAIGRAHFEPRSLWGVHSQKTVGHHRLGDRQAAFAKRSWPGALYYVWLWRLWELLNNTDFDYSSFETLKKSRGVVGEAFHGKMLLKNPQGGFGGSEAYIVHGDGPLLDFDPPMKTTFNGEIPFHRQRSEM